VKTVLITGFDAFDGNVRNSSGEWVQWMLQNEKIFVEEKRLHGVVLPVEYENSFNHLKQFIKTQNLNPDVIILTGLAKNRQQLSVERIGINWLDFRIPDNKGIQVRNSKIDVKGADGIFTTLDFEKIKKTVPDIAISTSAGEYVCNELLYRTLNEYQKENKEISFFHLPGGEDQMSVFIKLQNIVRSLL